MLNTSDKLVSDRDQLSRVYESVNGPLLNSADKQKFIYGGDSAGGPLSSAPNNKILTSKNDAKYQTMTNYQRFSNDGVSLHGKFINRNAKLNPNQKIGPISNSVRKHTFSPDIRQSQNTQFTTVNNIQQDQRSSVGASLNGGVLSGINQSQSFRSSQLGELNGITLNKMKKNKKEVDQDVQKLHNRIKMLQFEEEKALKKIEETRKKAKQLLEVKLANEKKRRNQTTLTPVRNSINLKTSLNISAGNAFDQPAKKDKRQEHLLIQSKMQQRKLEEVQMIKKEKKLIQKRKIQIEKAYLRKNQEKRIEIQYQQKEAQERIELSKKRKIDDKLRQKDKQIALEAKSIKKQEKQARQLELLEAEIVQRLKDTHLQQKDAIYEIEKIFKINTTGGVGANSSINMNISNQSQMQNSSVNGNNNHSENNLQE
eukprot:403370308